MNLKKFVFKLSNLMSLPAFFTLKNKNELNRIAQIEDKKNGVNFKVKDS